MGSRAEVSLATYMEHFVFLIQINCFIAGYAHVAELNNFVEHDEGRHLDHILLKQLLLNEKFVFTLNLYTIVE